MMAVVGVQLFSLGILLMIAHVMDGQELPRNKTIPGVCALIFVMLMIPLSLIIP